MKTGRWRTACEASIWPTWLALVVFSVAVMTANFGCAMMVSKAVNIVGGVVDDSDVKEKRKDLIGEPASVADQRFGEREDTLHEVGGDRTWQVYPVKGISNPLEKDRYVVEVDGGSITSLSRVEKTPDLKFDLPRAVMLESKVKGKTPAECEQILEEPPVVTVRSQNTGRLRQLYDGRMIKILSKPYYCILEFDDDDICEDVHFQNVGASTRRDPYSRGN